MIRAIQLLVGYQANKNYIVGQKAICPDGENRMVTGIQGTSSPTQYRVTCDRDVVLVVNAVNIIEQH